MRASRSRAVMLAASVLVLLVPMLACGAGDDDDQRTYRLERCGMQVSLGAHFTQTEGGPDRYAFRTADGSIELEITPGLPGDAASTHKPATFLPLATGGYDYDRPAAFAGFAAREARTHEPIGANIRARWGAAVETSRGLCYVRVTSIWDEPPDTMGEGFWTALHDRWLTPL